VPVAPADLLVGIIAALACALRLNGLTVDNACQGNNIALFAYPVKHQGQIVNRLGKEAPN
jgi:hypothetical protein